MSMLFHEYLLGTKSYQLLYNSHFDKYLLSTSKKFSLNINRYFSFLNIDNCMNYI